MSWFNRLREGLGKSSRKLGEGIQTIFTHRKLDDTMLEELEELLITSDLGVTLSARIVQEFAKNRFNKEVDPAEVKQALADEIAKVLNPVAVPLQLDMQKRPQVIMMVGVNGNGKTTTLGKLAQQFSSEGKKVLIAACDTFRAAAVEQLAVWGERCGCPVIRAEQGADPASVAYRALEEARTGGYDVLLVDTAGRLQNKQGLMEELVKITRVIKKLDEDAPHHTLLVLDATTGQNAHSQAQVFREMVQVTGMIVTKLDGTARGGVVVALAEKFGIPIHAVGVGESIEDLRYFEANAFANSLVGI